MVSNFTIILSLRHVRQIIDEVSIVNKCWNDTDYNENKVVKLVIFHKKRATFGAQLQSRSSKSCAVGQGQ